MSGTLGSTPSSEKQALKKTPVECCCSMNTFKMGWRCFFPGSRAFALWHPLEFRVRICFWALWCRPVIPLSWGQGAGGSQVQGFPELRMSLRLVWIAQRDLFSKEKGKIRPLCSSVVTVFAQHAWSPACMKPWVESSASHTWMWWCMPIISVFRKGMQKYQTFKVSLKDYMGLWDPVSPHPTSAPKRKNRDGVWAQWRGVCLACVPPPVCSHLISPFFLIIH